MKKIIVIGCMGSGKSTFAEKLHRKTKIPLFHLDNIWWKADRTHISREEFDSELNRIIQGDSWIIGRRCAFFVFRGKTKHFRAKIRRM